MASPAAQRHQSSALICVWVCSCGCVYIQGDAADVEGILASPAAQRHQNSALFLWMEGMAARLYRRAPEVAAKAPYTSSLRPHTLVA